jgi:shikimate kinase
MLLARCATMSNRPLFRDEASFRGLLAARLPFYAQADYRVVADTEPPRVVERILAFPPFERLTGSAPELSSRRVTS